MITKKIKEKCAKIKLVITDVDGVLTDGGMYYTEKGETMKKFNTRDGMAIQLLRNNIKTILMTQENSKIVLVRAKKIKADKAFIGIKNKETLLPLISKKYSVSLDEIAYIGDDYNDLNIIKKVGLSATPNNGIPEIKMNVDYVCEKNGGDGAFREFAELIIKYQS